MEEHESKAVQAVATTGGKAVDTITEFGRFLGKVVGTVPQDAVGLVIGDWLHEVRARNLHRMQQRTEEILRGREAARIQAVSPTLAIPLFKAAQDESRSELQELWARLLANAMDEARSGVRKSFIETVQKLDPLDAVILDRILKTEDLSGNIFHQDWPGEMGLRKDEFKVSLEHMKAIGCMDDIWQFSHDSASGKMRCYLTLTTYGRELLRACAV